VAWQDRDSRFFIGGEWVTPRSTGTLTVTSPFTGKPITTVSAGSTADMDAEIHAAMRSTAGARPE
jgi:acyl-CoA reductase-like NAD-dependent aldehyde dehydrogenase